MRVYVSSLGCKLNQSEMDDLAAQLTDAGHQIVTSPTQAHLCVLNTCAVTHVAAQKSRQALRRLHRENPSARLVATGCYAELAPEQLSGLPGVAHVVGNQAKEGLGEWVAGKPVPAPHRGPVPAPHRGPVPAPHRGPACLSRCLPGAPVPGREALPRRRTRALVKIQDGCDNACTYCVIRKARGRQRSREPQQILDDVRVRLAAGHQEIVLTGVHVGAYGRDRESSKEGADLWALVNRILLETDVPRLRLSSIEPWDLSEEVLDLWDDPRLCRHLHLPLQSGCDATLRRMERHYTTSGFAEMVSAAQDAIPDLAVTTDVIVGFPGETDADFEESLSFVRAVGFSRLHVFPYSLRDGTPAASLPAQVPAPVKASRAAAMRAVAAESTRLFRQRFIGRTMEVLWESCRGGNDVPLWSGLTGNYLRVYARDSRALANTMSHTHLVGHMHGGLQGEIVT
ncbi:tRNA (N(6)-L-threonylcarbamoyladenosine(37)-C(2))-methylthiotransferase MtaB [Chloroflexota bacterium]